MNNTIQKVVHQDDAILVNVRWNGRSFTIQIDASGVMVAPADKNDNIQLQSYPNVWIDTDQIVNPENYDNPKSGAPLLVHSYFKNDQDAPVTVELTKSEAIVRGDGLPFATILPHSR